MVEKMMRTCPFCGEAVKTKRGIMGIPFFECQNRECACIVSFRGTEKNPKAAEERWNKRGD